MTEQQIVATPSESASTSTPEEKPSKRSTSTKKAAKPTKKLAQKASSLTDEQKRLARNAALREWRKKNADRVKAYMTEWRAKRSGKEQPAQPSPAATPSTTVPKPASKKTTKAKKKKGGKA